jgi:hypothetical protein
MKAYCKHCHTVHAAWNRLNDGYICGLCGTRERDPQVTPVNAVHYANGASTPQPRRNPATTVKR